MSGLERLRLVSGRLTSCMDKPAPSQTVFYESTASGTVRWEDSSENKKQEACILPAEETETPREATGSAAGWR